MGQGDFLGRGDFFLQYSTVHTDRSSLHPKVGDVEKEKEKEEEEEEAKEKKSI